MVCSSPPHAASSKAGINARVLLYFMANISSELQGKGAADNVDIAVCCYAGFSAIKIYQGKVALLQLLVLVAQIKANREGQKASTVIGGTYAEANHYFVRIQVVDFRVASGFQRGFLIGHAAPDREVLIDVVLSPNAWDYSVLELYTVGCGGGGLVLDGVAFEDF